MAFGELQAAAAAPSSLHVVVVGEFVAVQAIDSDELVRAPVGGLVRVTIGAGTAIALTVQLVDVAVPV